MNVLTLPGAMTPTQIRVFKETCQQIAEAIQDAQDAGVPQGMIVAALHGYTHRETAAMMEDSE
jgi:hypothetical protein